MPERNSRGPTLIAELRFGFARPGEPSAFGVSHGGAPLALHGHHRNLDQEVRRHQRRDDGGPGRRTGGEAGPVGGVHAVEHGAVGQEHPRGDDVGEASGPRPARMASAFSKTASSLGLDVALHQRVVGAAAGDQAREEQRVAGPDGVAERRRRRGPALRQDARLGRCPRPAATADTWIRAPGAGSFATTVVLAGGDAGQYFAQTAFSAAKSPASARYTDVETTRSIDVPARSSRAFNSSSTWCRLCRDIRLSGRCGQDPRNEDQAAARGDRRKRRAGGGGAVPRGQGHGGSCRRGGRRRDVHHDGESSDSGRQGLTPGVS